MAAVSVFLQAYSDAEDYPYLNRLICAWREAEELTRQECGLPSVTRSYPGCFNYNRKLRASNSTLPLDEDDVRRLKARRITQQRILSAQDIMLQNVMNYDNSTFTQKKILFSDDDLEPMEDDETYRQNMEAYFESQGSPHHRRTADYSYVPFNNYGPTVDIKTEYYFRYSGTLTVPPCHGRFFIGNDRRQTNNWRIMKDPLRVSSRQVLELNRLLRQRIAPADDPLRACKTDTAGKTDSKDSRKISVARPLQSKQKTHYQTYCECLNWKSKFQEDLDWCELDFSDRFSDRPYNFRTDGY
jgi:Eukaryotic-type carbonic anhydrase